MLCVHVRFLGRDSAVTVMSIYTLVLRRCRRSIRGERRVLKSELTMIQNVHTHQGSANAGMQSADLGEHYKRCSLYVKPFLFFKTKILQGRRPDSHP